jgi:Spy/CpxP family protein refolding chaperone
VKTNIKTLAVIFSVILNIAFVAGYVARIFSERPTFAYEELELSNDQRTRFEAARNRFLPILNENTDKIIRRHIELMDLIAAEPVDRQAIDSKFQEIRSVQRSMANSVVEHLLEDKQILQPDQQEKFFAVLKSRIQKQGAPGPPWLPEGARRRKQ